MGTAAPLRPVAVALGSNLGDRVAHLEYAVGQLRGVLADLVVSRFYETDPEEGPAHPRFLNAAAVGLCAWDPERLLARLLEIERARGRERPFPGAPRTLDLDLILVGDLVIESPALILPHPRFRQRWFVLRPLAEIAPQLVDPVTRLTVGALLEALG